MTSSSTDRIPELVADITFGVLILTVILYFIFRKK